MIFSPVVADDCDYWSKVRDLRLVIAFSEHIKGLSLPELTINAD